MNTIDHKNLPEILFEANQIAQSAGLKILEIYETDFSVVKKDDNSPLTLADTEAHKIICESLRKKATSRMWKYSTRSQSLSNEYLIL